MGVKQKTLIILTPGFPNNEEDINCLPERQSFVKALKEASPNIKIIVLSFQYPFKQKHYRWHNVEVYSFNGRGRGKVIRLIVWFRVWQKLKTLRRRNSLIGVISFWLGECALIGNYFAKKYHVKHYCWLLGQDAKAGNKYVPLVKPTAKSLIALSDFLADEFFKNYLIRPKHV